MFRGLALKGAGRGVGNGIVIGRFVSYAIGSLGIGCPGEE